MKKFQAILWDCDGCLIDSELIACGHAAEVITQAGYPISTQDFVRRFAGQGKKHIFDTIKNEIGKDIQPAIDRNNKKEQRDALFRQFLKPIEGIHDFLNVLKIPMAVASGSEMDRLELTLQLTQLENYFGSHVYSSSLVKNGKPAPDIFLYAAEALQTQPESCLVIEDSINGVRSGKAAGMTVFGFSGGSHVFDKSSHREDLIALGADHVFDTMSQMHRFIKDNKLIDLDVSSHQ